MVSFGDVLAQLFDPYLLLVILASSAYGLVIGAIPGLTALMASALLVPFVIFMDPIPAVATIITASAMAIFAGDIPGALMRMPGTPASAAYTDDAYGLTRKGKAALGLGAGVIASAIGGLVGAMVLTFAAPVLARIALSFSSVEYFWMAVLGLSCATFVAGQSLVKGLAALFLGLGIATIGMDPVSGIARFTFGHTNLMGGLGLIPVLIGLFALSEILRNASTVGDVIEPKRRIGPIFRTFPGLVWRHKRGIGQGSVVGTLIGILPGAGADVAAWISYALTKRTSKVGRQNTEEGAVERIISSSAANNASLSGAYVPATVFGIPGDAITAIVISVMFIKGINPGPTLFLNNPETIYTIFAIFFLANIIMVPMGVLCIHGFGLIVSIPRAYVFPLILMFCILGSFSVENTLFSVGVVAVVGLIGYAMEVNDIPFAPAILGLILGPLIEQTFMTSMLKSQGAITVFFERPIGAAIGAVTIAVWLLVIVLKIRSQRTGGEAVPEA